MYPVAKLLGTELAKYAGSARFATALAVPIRPADVPGSLCRPMLLNLLGVLEYPGFQIHDVSFLERATQTEPAFQDWPRHAA
jgi:hypothetical protein